MVRLLQTALPLAIAAAILQYRLWAIELVVRRALLYAALSACVVLGYALLIAGLSALVRAQGGALAVLVAATLVALAFEPLRTRLLRASRRLLYGERDEPYVAVQRLGATLEAAPGAIPERIVTTVAGSLKLPYVAVDLVRGDTLHATAAWGERPATESLHPIVLSHQGETIGQLVVAPRRGEATLSSPDQLLLEELARQASAALRAQLLTADLQRAREALVLAREEERRRIRRDLHDELGPTLASQTLRLDAAIELLAERPAQAAELLAAIKARNQALVAEIRRLVYELRPPALDELGLEGALRAAAGNLGAAAPAIRISAAPEPLPALPAAVEVAAYRIALEALTNAVRHAAARRCEVRLEIAADGPHGLRITVVDDGWGIAPGAPAGVGLRSMRERAEELGGSLTVAPGGDGGTVVSAWLPIAAPAEEERR
jgi:signal transduction histidine kinase